MLQPAKTKLRLPYRLKIPVSKVEKGVTINFPKELLHKMHDGIQITFTK